MKRIIFFSTLCLLLASCSKDKQFVIEGKIADANGKTIYLLNSGMSNNSIIDSVKIKENGDFKFRQKAVATPDFFNLKIDNQTITLAVDSCETIKVDANANNLFSSYKVQNSPESEKIRTIISFGTELKGQLQKFDKLYIDKKISAQVFSDTVLSAVQTYKDRSLPYIFENPRSATAYFTLFQRVNGLLIFDPYLKSDIRAYGAVATSWDSFYPESERSKQLKNIVLMAMREQRRASETGVDLSSIQEQNSLEIVLPNIKGKEIKLSDMKGKVTLLSFTAYETDYSGPFNISLSTIYDKFKDKGFEIFQVSLDADENLWKVTSSNLPWITVRDKESIYSNYAKTFNVTSLPTSYLIDKEGNIVSRVTDLKGLDISISKLLN
ncbi:MAG: TlpA disulfide reductase family protein [Bacteroidales bacterium]|nr:TlpA disulfide reductase family protein [Bacteroidales bacterium]